MLDIQLQEVGGKKTFKLYLKSEQTDRQTHTQTHILTNRLIESIGPEDQCFEKSLEDDQFVVFYIPCDFVERLLCFYDKGPFIYDVRYQRGREGGWDRWLFYLYFFDREGLTTSLTITNPP